MIDTAKKKDYTSSLEVKIMNTLSENSNILNSKNLLDKKFDIYKKHSITEIRSGISRFQTFLLSMHDMAFVASLADTSIVLPAPIKYAKLGMHTDISEKRYQENRLFTVNNFEKNITAYNKLSSRYTSRYELFSKIREVYPEFGQNMNKKISSDDFQLYSQVLRNFKKVTSSTMEYTDTLPASDVLLNQQDKIAEVVDSIDFTRACEIEDKFMISELDTFFKNLSSMPPEVKHGFQKHNILMPDGKKSSYLELAQKVKNDRLKRIEKYGKIYKIYNKLKEHPYMRIEYDDKETR